VPNVEVKSPVFLFRFLLGLVFTLVLVGVAITVSVTHTVDSKAEGASESAGLAQLAAEASDRLREMSQIVQNRIDQALESPDIAQLTEAEHARLAAWLNGEAQTPPSAAIAVLSAPLDMGQSIDFYAAYDYLISRRATLISGVDSPELQQALQQRNELSERILNTYYSNPTLGNLRNLHIGIDELQRFTAAQLPRFSQESTTLSAELNSSIFLLRWGIVGIAILGGTCVVLLGWYMSRTNQRLLSEAHQEGQELAELTQSLEYRNNQLNALYNVFNEITGTLSLPYVVRATLLESLKIMRADMVVLRILKGENLEVAGAMTGSEQEVSGIPPVKLGEGPTGRTAKRGRTLRIDEGGEGMMAPADTDLEASGQLSQPIAGRQLESGLIVPLIVGARVVGTLSCWSQEVRAFSDGDERVLEMMASQVATAIVAADTTEKSESRAVHDPLTLLPNRRQLDNDIAGRLKDLADAGRAAVVAMVDIDHFKQFNDDYGHRVGDVTLQKVASVLRGSARDNDLVYRYGGEEFVVVFVDSRPADALTLAERLRQAVEAAPLSGEHLDPVGPVTVSIGLAMLPQHGTDLRELIDLADKAMYRAKAAGRNRVEVWDGPEQAPGLSEVA
jgi:diguanylate cyclase (GGDEF)-like protein